MKRQPPAVEVCGLLPVKLTAHCSTVLSGTKPLEAIVDQLGVLLVEVFVSHNVRGAGVHLTAADLKADTRHGKRYKSRCERLVII